MNHVLVAGGSSGIGLAISQALVADGYAVTALGRDVSSLKTMDNIEAKHFDPADCDNLDKRIEQLVFACPQISSLVLSAGYGRFGSLEEFSSVQIREMTHINLVAQMLLVRAFLPQLRRHNLGHIVFIGSEAGLQGGRKGAVYSASKFALRGFSQALRLETSNRNLGVSIVNPGMVRTGFFEALSFEPGPQAHHAIDVADVAAAVSMIFAMRPGTVVDEVNLSPRQHVVKHKPAKDDS